MNQSFDTYLKEELKKGFIEECLLDSENTDNDQELAEILRKMRNARRRYSIKELFGNYPVYSNAVSIILNSVFKYYELTSKTVENK
ncbi:hypothetical protein [Bacillus wiedmannii]|uniref:hypothetical protein n=1 Tax=Bacillus wiedmannii TaxID=1890302 RepID=UPI000BF05D90|nr:hypothetical protein [Bacillus wiedmannii]PEM14467.1 hypothetical protein CN610_01810 [Bacillus wiedmannii]PHD07894.1 hypothetical protein COF45_22735 [Bacillus wiedmannii]